MSKRSIFNLICLFLIFEWLGLIIQIGAFLIKDY